MHGAETPERSHPGPARQRCSGSICGECRRFTVVRPPLDGYMRCKSPAMVRKELWCHLLAYNLVRHLMWDAGQTKDRDAGRTSFKGTIQYLISFRAFFGVTTSHQNRALLKRILDLIATQEVPYRPHRVEPRVKKRRPKNYRLMNKPRADLRAALIGA